MKPVTEDAIAEAVVCGPDASRYVEKIRTAEQAGYTHVCLHQVGPAQEAFLEFCAREVLPAFGGRSVGRRGPRAARAGGRRTAARKQTATRRS
jgi:hypothetical protein